MHGGAHTGGSSRDFDRSPRPGTSRSSAREEHYRSGASRRSPVPSGGADDDRSSTFESVDFARDDSFRAVLGLIREFHDMAEPSDCACGSVQDVSCVGLRSNVGVLLGIYVACFPPVIDAPVGH